MNRKHQNKSSVSAIEYWNISIPKQQMTRRLLQSVIELNAKIERARQRLCKCSCEWKFIGRRRLFQDTCVLVKIENPKYTSLCLLNPRRSENSADATLVGCRIHVQSNANDAADFDGNEMEGKKKLHTSTMCLSSQLNLKLDEEKWRSHFVCVITIETRFHSIPNTVSTSVWYTHERHCALFTR